MFDALAMGIKDTHSFMMQVFENLRGLFTGKLSITVLGGPITIARVAYGVAGVDFWEFLFFLGMVSVNLAVIEFSRSQSSTADTWFCSSTRSFGASPPPSWCANAPRSRDWR